MIYVREGGLGPVFASMLRPGMEPALPALLMPRPRLVFLGSDAIAVPALDFLIECNDYDLLGVVSQPDRPVGRGKKLQANPLAAAALERGLTLLRPEKPDAEMLNWIKEQNIDLGVVMAYGHILSQSMIDAPSNGMINLHASLLPAYRGASPIIGAIANGDKKTGLTLMRIARQMDTGPVMNAEIVSISNVDTRKSLTQKLAESSPVLLLRSLPLVFDGRAKFEEQNHSLASYTRKILKEDAELDFKNDAQSLLNRMRALDPWPGSYVMHGDVRLKLAHPSILETLSDADAGTVIDTGPEGISISTDTHTIRMGSLQRPGGKMLPASEFLRGYKLEPGSVFSAQPMQALMHQGEPFPK